jgi:anti-sigma B factor antagonist
MHIEECREGSVLVITLRGRLDGVTCRCVDERFSEVAALGQPVVIDCSGLDYVSSAGLRSILVLGKRQRASRIGFTLASPAPAVREIFELSGFHSLFSVHDHRASAVEALGG